MQNALPKDLDKDEAIVDSGCSRHMTGNKDYLVDFKEIIESMLYPMIINFINTYIFDDWMIICR